MSVRTELAKIDKEIDALKKDRESYIFNAQMQCPNPNLFRKIK